MPTCDKCKKEFYDPRPGDILLFEGECMDCLSPEKRQRLDERLKRLWRGGKMRRHHQPEHSFLNSEDIYVEEVHRGLSGHIGTIRGLRLFAEVGGD